MTKAVILVSGGLDSATALALARQEGFECYALNINYGQRHASELDAARRIAAAAGVVEYKVFNMDLGEFGGSALTDYSIAVPEQPTQGIPVTYVPARNTIFLSLALAWAEVIKAWNIFIGVNIVDYSGYPDCRPEYIQAFESVANLATRSGVEGHSFHIQTPLINLTKAQIIQVGTRLGVDYAQTVSCYAADEQGRACGVCDSCRIRAAGFKEAGIPDPTRYQ
jgi:7-cyano-7-deazaguanine synthase